MACLRSSALALIAGLLALLTAHALAGPVQAQDSTQRRAEAPDRRDIVFTSDRAGPDNEIWRMGADSSNPRRLTHNEGVRDNFPAWSPDRRQIAFLSNRDTSRQGTGIYVMNADGSDVRQLTSGPTADRCASWRPGGNRIVYVAESEDGDTSRVMIKNLSTGDARNALPDGMEGACAYWSPGGGRIAFFSGPDGQLRSLKSTRTDGPGVQEIYMLDLRTESVTQLTDAGAISNYPRWSPGGQRLVFESTRAFDEPLMEEGQIHYEWFDVYTMNPDGSNVRRLTENEHFDAHPNW